ncbi:MAG: hypothetical protein AAF662_02800 [Pseudomonadota bacterium]
MDNQAQDHRTVRQPALLPEVIDHVDRLLDDSTVEEARIFDVALSWFFEQQRTSPIAYYVAETTRCTHRTVWVSNEEYERAKLMADRDGVSVDRVLATAFTLYALDRRPERGNGVCEF